MIVSLLSFQSGCSPFVCTADGPCASAFGPLYECVDSVCELVPFREVSVPDPTVVPTGDTDVPTTMTTTTTTTTIEWRDLLITEVMVTPVPGTAQWFEVYNASKDMILLQGLGVGVVGVAEAAHSYFVLQEDEELKPGEFYVVTDTKGIDFASGFENVRHEPWPSEFSFGVGLYLAFDATTIAQISWPDMWGQSGPCDESDLRPASWFLSDLESSSPEDTNSQWERTSENGYLYDVTDCNRGSPGKAPDWTGGP